MLCINSFRSQLQLSYCLSLLVSFMLCRVLYHISLLESSIFLTAMMLQPCMLQIISKNDCHSTLCMHTSCSELDILVSCLYSCFHTYSHDCWRRFIVASIRFRVAIYGHTYFHGTTCTYCRSNSLHINMALHSSTVLVAYTVCRGLHSWLLWLGIEHTQP